MQSDLFVPLLPVPDVWFFCRDIGSRIQELDGMHLTNLSDNIVAVLYLCRFNENLSITERFAYQLCLLR